MEKRSEFVKKRRDFWWTNNDARGTADWHAELDAQAAEAAGIAWGPEAPALPERLIYAEGTTCVGAAGTADGVRHVVAYGKYGDAILREAVRRYNAWPALRAWAAGARADGFGTSRLLAILDGPAK